ncbi:MAG: NADH-quinone oxidoreductase subunit C [Verrucomicrobiota bacterium]
MTAPADATAALRERFPSATPRPSLDHPAANIPATEALAALRYLRDEQGFDFLVDLTAIDWGADACARFTVVWHLFSTTSLAYLRLAADCADNAAPAMASAVPLWPGAEWHERETYDMFGIHFAGHPDLRRILMWDGYAHHPLRKDFPLAGIEGELSDPEVATETGTKVIAAPMAGGPFVAAPGEMNLTDSEPRAKDESWNEAREKPI